MKLEFDQKKINEIVQQQNAPNQSGININSIWFMYKPETDHNACSMALS